jgi:hypothetical protein
MTGAPVPFLRFSRDKRGYEHFYLVQPTTNRRGKTRTRILYWFRTPPGVKVGRLPFSDEVQRAIEAQNPGVNFDWKKLLATPIPPPAPDVERWRERRRVERAEKASRRALAVPADDEPAEPDDDDQIAEIAASRADEETPALLDVETESIAAREPPVLDEPLAAGRQPDAVQGVAAQPVAALERGARKRRRRRRGGGRTQGPANGNPPSSNGRE